MDVAPFSRPAAPEPGRRPAFGCERLNLLRHGCNPSAYGPHQELPMIRALALSGLATLLCAHAGAQTVLHFREGQRVEPQEVRRILDSVERREGMTRSIRLLSDRPGAPAPATAPAPPSALSLPVQFDFDSATILPAARDQLDALAEGIKLLPQSRRVVIEGHTDAIGSDEYNNGLSQRRAAAVKLYLVRQHGIDPRRLQDTGRGEREPIGGADPYAPENRRVQFRGG
jgi:outer membrane protein OmpA-like peptidoglycan-associated protein